MMTSMSRSKIFNLKKTNIFLSRYSTLQTSNERPNPDNVLVDIANYVHNKEITSLTAYQTAKLCFLDTLGCGLASLKYKQVQDIIKPIVPLNISQGVKILGTSHQFEPIHAGFALGTMFRWLDFNDCWLAKEWGHPSDNLGAILAVTDFLNRTENRKFKMRDVLENMIKAHEIQGIFALENSFNEVGLDHVILVKIASIAVVANLIGLNIQQTIDAISHAFVDGHPLRTYRHAPNTNSRKSWAAGDAISRAIKLAFMVKNSNIGPMQSVLTAKNWGFYDVLFNGNQFKFNLKFNSYVMENILFKISYPAEFHAQTAVEAAMKAHTLLTNLGKSYKDIKSVRIRTQDAAMRIIDKSGPLYNYADRDHCIQYMIAIPLIYGRLTAQDYHDEVALSNTDIDTLRSKMYCVRDDQFTKDYLDPQKRSIPNALTIELNDGTILDEIVVEYPVGHKFRRDEGIPLLLKKFENHLKDHYQKEPAHVENILKISYSKKFESVPVHEYLDQFWLNK
ncbi:hypothetical protein KAFR_0B01840 [Kazachstania africana CBS 2517]|uniref:2-methylcitrate dehydratase n=1 Tax=Kazachstania africana (strain ATCC 22294 / BCRC 22015 / CBS 2517 / CECT 1963 / NBRC 1671 / NRRL Y-8276) TaxID=1071382 RepID=H2AQ33_KAZAF|nr:hypothetical protein KAFR_0B01840 [Kazachstania africana CBS 2517]CCF56483.1 hypothetical protein KAFR_0B01840 [Kazachstania africana CBS 2517]